MIARLIFAIAALCLAGTAHAQLAPPLPQGAEIVVATSEALAPALRRAAAAFDPTVRIRIVAEGSDVAMAWLSSGRADIAVIGRDASDPEAKAYEWVFRHPPLATPVMRGSVMTPGHSPDLAVRVNAANPITALSLDQLRAMLAPGSTARLVIPDAESGTGRYLRKTLRDGAAQFEWVRVSEASGNRIAQAVAADRGAIGFGDAQPMAGTRIVRIDGSVPGDASYPLARKVLAYADPAPRSDAARFLAFLLSDAGQAVVARAPWRPLR